MAGKTVGPWARASGIALGIVVLLQLVVGFYLNTIFTPTAAQAHETVQAIREDPFKAVLQNIHYWGSAWLIVHGFLHLALLIFSGAYRNISRWAWLGLVLVFGSSFAMQVTGNLLPFDNHDVQTAVIEGGIASRVPLAGSFAAATMLAGPHFGPETLEAWHRAHLWLIVPLVLGGNLCIFAFQSRDPKPRGLVRWFWVIPLAGIGLVSALLSAPHGPGATPPDYSAFDARPSWYTWPMHGALNTFEGISSGFGWIGTALLPGFFGILLLVAPWLGAKKDGLVRWLFGLFALGFGLMAVLKGGAPAPAWGQQEVKVASSTSSGHIVPVDEIKAKRGFERAQKLCSPCHGNDLAGSTSAPNLLKMYQRHSDAKWLIQFLKDPRSVKPSSTMGVSFENLTDQELAELAEWLRKPK